MFTLDIAPDEAEKYRIVATSRDISLWERTTKGASLKRLEENTMIGDLEHIGWLASKRQGLFGGSLLEFRATCDVTPIDVAKEAEEAGEDEPDADALGVGPT
jgi:hypothetical protein